MNEKPKGIFNPFAPKKKKKPTIQDFEERKTESGIVMEPSVTFDGDSYSLKFEGITDLKEATARLTSLLYDVSRVHGATLTANGIVVKPGEPQPPMKDEMALAGPNYGLTVYVGNPPHTEDMAYRRIAYTLKKLAINGVLAKYKATVSERG